MTTERLATLATEFAVLYKQLEAATLHKTAIQKKFDHYKIEVIPDAMDEESITSCQIEGIGRLGLTNDARVSTIDKEAAFAWVRENGYEDLITETINGSTLKSFLKEMKAKGEEIPEDAFKYQPFTRASITKAR